MTTDSKERPYKPSLIDQFNNWVEELPVHTWVFYVLFGIVLILIQILFLWLEGGLGAQELLPVIIFNGFATPFLFALIHLFDNQAVSALNSLRPTLDMTETDFDLFEFKLSNMPSLAALVAGMILMVNVMLMELVTPAPVRYAALEQLPIFKIVFHIIDKSSAFMYGAFVYHTIRQLNLVNTINSNHVHINLFNLGPTKSFSKLTATTTVGLVIGVFAWMLINPDLLKNPINFGFSLGFSVLAIGVFVWPLWGVHRLIEIEKARALREIDHRFEMLFGKLNQHVLDDDYAEAERLNGTIASLDIQYRRISAIPTWPWSPETGRIALTAIALPMVMMIIQFLVLQALNR